MAMQPSPKSLTDQYRTLRPRYEELARRLRELIEQLLTGQGIQPHSVTARAKEHASLERKVARPGRDYRRLSDVTDLCGVRVTTYFTDDVDRVCQVLRAEFTIDKQHSSDRRSTQAPDQFGYTSVHYVAKIGARRARLPEWRPLRDLQFEVQVRSILQHAWAEIEHDLGYKSEASVPRQVRRRFSRLSGLLELADDEFASLRGEIVSYRQRLKDQVVSDPRAVQLNRDSLMAYLQASLDSHGAGMT